MLAIHDAAGYAMMAAYLFAAAFIAPPEGDHHHGPPFVRLSHSASGYDFGFLTVPPMVRLGLATPTEEGRTIPEGSTLSEVGL